MRRSRSHFLRGKASLAAVALLATWLACGTGQAQLPAVPPTPRPAVPAGPPPNAGHKAGDEKKGYKLKFKDAPIVEVVLDDYSRVTSRALLLSPTLPKANITLVSDDEYTLDEYLLAIDTVLAMNGIALLKVGEKFLQVVPVAQARQEAMPIQTDGSEALTEDGKLVSQMITLKNIDLAEARKAIEPFKHPYGVINNFENINALLLTDSAATVNRMIQIIGYIDQPMEAREEPFIVLMKYTKASEIKKRLEELIADSQQKEAQRSTVPRPSTSGSPGVMPPNMPATPPGVIRPTPAMSSRLPEPESLTEAADLAERGIIRGKVKIVADDRTNVLIIITRPENMKFFEKVISVLDVETAPDVIVRVTRLEYAEAKSVAGMLNDLIGAKSGKDEASAKPATGATGAGETEGSRVLRDFVRPPTPAATPAATSAEGVERKSKIGELSKENIKILSDERTNALIIMASKSDMATLEEIIKGMDIMLSQVLIEAVILQVSLENTRQSGVDWVQRSLIAFDKGAGGKRDPVFAFSGGGGGGKLSPLDATSLSSTYAAGAGLTYYFTHFGLNMDAVIKWTATDSRAKVLSSPVILTTDNKEAKIDVSQELYFYKGQTPTSVGGSIAYVPNVESRKVGLNLTVKPRINQKKFVVMEITQKIENKSGTQVIADQGEWPVVATRELTASVAVQGGETVVLGGLVENNNTSTRSGVPFLSSIPLLGIPFRASGSDNTRTEIVIFITPYVLDNPEAIAAESIRRRQATSTEGVWTRGWSNSKIAEAPTPPESVKHRSLLGRIFGRNEEQESKPTVSPPVAPPPVAPAATTPVVSRPKAGADTDPELRRFIESEDQRWGKSLDKVDQRVDKGL